MTQDISSLMDGELDAQEADRAIRSCCASEEQKQTWNLYHAIGDALRGQAPRELARCEGIMQAIENQPTVLAPRRRVLETPLGRVALAAAASVATIGVVGWIGMQGGPETGAPLVAKGGPASALKPVAATTTVAAPQPTLNVQDYLTAHRQIPSPEQYRPVANRGAVGAR